MKAEAGIVGGIRTNVVVVLLRVVQPTVRAHPARKYIPLRYAINKLHESILTPPEIRREIDALLSVASARAWNEKSARFLRDR